MCVFPVGSTSVLQGAFSVLALARIYACSLGQHGEKRATQINAVIFRRAAQGVNGHRAATKRASVVAVVQPRANAAAVKAVHTGQRNTGGCILAAGSRVRIAVSKKKVPTMSSDRDCQRVRGAD